MTTSINTNISAFFGQNNLRASSADAQNSIARLSSGNQIIRAADDVAGLSVGTILRTDVSTLRTALNNTSQASSLIQVADGAIERIGEILQRQKALAVQGNSDGLSDTERGYLNQEFQALVLELDRIVSRTEFNGTNLIDGTLAATTTTLATEDSTVGAESIGRLRTGETLDSTVLGSNGNGTIELGNNGTTVGNTTQQKLIGSLAEASVGGSLVAAATDLAQFTVTVNGVSFVSANVDLDEVQNDVVFTAADGSGVTFTLDIADNTANITTGTLTQGEVNTVAQNIQAELRKFDFYADKTLESTASTDSSAITAEKFNGTVLQGLDGNDFQLVGTNFSTTDGKAPSISSFNFDSLSTQVFTASVDIGGVTYSTANLTATADGVAINNDADFTDEDISGAGNGVLRLVSADDSNSYIDIDLSAAAAGLDGRSDSLVDGIEAALNGAFGSGATGGASFQVGINSADTISVAIGDLSSTSIYKDSSGASQVLSVATGDASVTASNVLDIAINTVTAARADVGASQSRFDFAAASIEVSITNLDAARAGFLDADISEASTQFAQEQVLIQASISVLAQANQLPQNLLKLIG